MNRARVSNPPSSTKTFNDIIVNIKRFIELKVNQKRIPLKDFERVYIVKNRDSMLQSYLPPLSKGSIRSRTHSNGPFKGDDVAVMGWSPLKAKMVKVFKCHSNKSSQRIKQLQKEPLWRFSALRIDSKLDIQIWVKSGFNVPYNLILDKCHKCNRLNNVELSSSGYFSAARALDAMIICFKVKLTK